MAKYKDLDGLKNIFMALGQIDVALKSHIDDLEKLDKAKGSGHAEALETARNRLAGSQDIIGRTFRALS